jgi:hypothetical protein
MMFKAHVISLAANWNETAEWDRMSRDGNNSFYSPGPIWRTFLAKKLPGHVMSLPTSLRWPSNQVDSAFVQSMKSKASVSIPLPLSLIHSLSDLKS